MTTQNPKNQFTTDDSHTQKRVPQSMRKARVKHAYDHPDESGFHTVRIRMYGEGNDRATGSVFDANVLTPMAGCVWIPQTGMDVQVLFDASGNPWIVGAWYAKDRVLSGNVDLPDYEAGDIRLGNATGSHVTVHNDGHISIMTDGNESVNIDHQSAVAYLGSNFSFTTANTYHTIPFSVEHDDPDDIFDPTQNAMVVQNGHQHQIRATIEIAGAGQNVLYTLALFKNGSEMKRKNRQSAVNEPLSLSVATQQSLDAGDVITARIRKDGSTQRTITADPAATEFTIARRGI